MKCEDACVMALSLMRRHLTLRDDPSGRDGWYFEWSDRKANYGDCSYLKKRIRLAKGLTKVCSADQVRDTVLHEIAHALVGPGHGHDRIWRAKALEVGCKTARSGSEYPPESTRQLPWTWCMCDKRNGAIHTIRFRKPTGRIYKYVERCGLKGRPDTRGSLQWLKREEYLSKWGVIRPMTKAANENAL